MHHSQKHTLVFIFTYSWKITNLIARMFFEVLTLVTYLPTLQLQKRISFNIVLWKLNQ